MFSAALAVVVLAVVTAWAVSRLRTSETSGSVRHLQINPPPGGQFGRAGSPVPTLALSPDGKTLVYGASCERSIRYQSRSLGCYGDSALPGSEDAFWPSWSLDSRYIAFAARGKLQRLDVTDGPPFAVSDIPQGVGSAWTVNHDCILLGFSTEGRRQPCPRRAAYFPH